MITLREAKERHHEDALMYSALLDPGQHVVHQLSQRRNAWACSATTPSAGETLWFLAGVRWATHAPCACTAQAGSKGARPHGHGHDPPIQGQALVLADESLKRNHGLVTFAECMNVRSIQP